LVTLASLTANITPASLSMTNLSAANKVYDATPTATLSNATLVGILNADAVSLSTPLTGTFADKNVGTAKEVTVSSLALTGMDASNYTLNAPASLTANITPASLSMTNLSAANKVYDATPTATLSSATLAGILNADAVSLSAPLTGTFADKNVGVAKVVTVSGITLTGADAGNYTFNDNATTNADINRAIKIEWVSTLDKEWTNGTNWDQGVVPDDTQDVNISNTGVLINISGTQSVNSLSSLNSLHLDDNSSMSIKNPFTLKNGTILNGNGTFNTATFTNEGTISPGNSPGKITIIGNYVQTEQGSIKFEIKGNSPDLYDQIIVTGSAKLGGKINVLTLDNFTPLNLGTFEFITAGDITGNFKEIVGSSDLVTILPTLQLGQIVPPSVSPQTPNTNAEDKYTNADEVIKEFLKDRPPEQAKFVEKEIDDQNNSMLTMSMANLPPVLPMNDRPPPPPNEKMESPRLGEKIDSPSAARNIGDEKNEKTEGGKGDNEKNEKDEKKPKKSEIMASSTGVNETRAVPTLQQCK